MARLDGVRGRDTRQLAAWQLVLSPEPGADPIIVDAAGTPIATLHGDPHKAFVRAVLVLRSPQLRDVAAACLEVFRVMATHERGRPRAAANDMLAALQAALIGLEDDPL